MKIVLGSTSTTKKELLKTILSEYIQDKIDIQGVEVDSQVADQPLNEKITIKGSMARSKNALKALPKANFSVGMEGGLDMADGKQYFLVCAVAITDGKGKVFVGVSSKLRLPKKVSDDVLNGKQFGKAIRDYAKKHEHDLRFQPLLKELITRRLSFTEAARNSCLTYINQKH